ncbi:uncharacterized protein LOC143143485 [Ptiloglossa arizonensis]|uniref:uncharacterized protein LOC143143485 n=1 Tax=Ptiloglossa arizonensis TaxID=3350558 RepID=UPI003FA03FB0
MVRQKSDPRLYNSDTNTDTSRTSDMVDKSRRKRHRQMRVLQEIRHFRNTVNFLIPRLRFARLVKEIVEQFSLKHVTRIQSTAMEALQEATEVYLIQFFEDCNSVAISAKRITIMLRDMHLIRLLRGPLDPGN